MLLLRSIIYQILPRCIVCVYTNTDQRLSIAAIRGNSQQSFILNLSADQSITISWTSYLCGIIHYCIAIAYLFTASDSDSYLLHHNGSNGSAAVFSNESRTCVDIMQLDIDAHTNLSVFTLPQIYSLHDFTCTYSW